MLLVNIVQNGPKNPNMKKMGWGRGRIPPPRSKEHNSTQGSKFKILASQIFYRQRLNYQHPKKNFEKCSLTFQLQKIRLQGRIRHTALRTDRPQGWIWHTASRPFHHFDIQKHLKIYLICCVLFPYCKNNIDQSLGNVYHHINLCKYVCHIQCTLINIF